MSRRIDWTPEMDALLGTETDPEIGSTLGMSRDAVAARRKQLGIVAYRQRKRPRKCATCGAQTPPRPARALGPFYCSAACARVGRRGRLIRAIRECSVEGCSSTVTAKGMCQTHYLRMKNGVALDAPPPARNKGATCSVDGCEADAYCRGMCGLHYGRASVYGDPLRQRASFEERFWIRVDTSGGPAACWLWTGTLSEGYGHLGAERGRPQERAHAVAWRLTNGPVPLGRHLDHTCHNADLDCEGGKGCRHRACCNPAHLEPVTPKENNDRARARRFRGATCSYGHTGPRDAQGRCRECRSRSEGGASRLKRFTKPVVLDRCEGRCEACGEPLGREFVTHFHHRKLRGQGGDNEPCNIVALHSVCHVLAPRAVHQNTAWARERGLIVPRHLDPAQVPLVLPSGRVVLLDPDFPWYNDPPNGPAYRDVPLPAGV